MASECGLILLCLPDGAAVKKSIKAMVSKLAPGQKSIVTVDRKLKLQNGSFSLHCLFPFRIIGGGQQHHFTRNCARSFNSFGTAGRGFP